MPDKDYSHRDITDKLGLKPGQTVRVVGPGDRHLLSRVRAKIGRGLIRTGQAEVVLYWPRTVDEIAPALTDLKHRLVPNGSIWVMTAKKNRRSTSGLEYFKQDALIPMGRAAGLVDNKICSLSESESAMRFVIRKKDRGL